MGHVAVFGEASGEQKVIRRKRRAIVPLGIGEHLRRWGVPEDRIVELDWDESHAISRPGIPDLTLVCTEARHFSGRGLVSNATLWSSWKIVGTTGTTPASGVFMCRFSR